VAPLGLSLPLFDGIVKALAGQPWWLTQAPSAAEKKTISAPHPRKLAA
jgi:hypothetical protein